MEAYIDTPILKNADHPTIITNQLGDDNKPITVNLFDNTFQYSQGFQYNKFFLQSFNIQSIFDYQGEVFVTDENDIDNFQSFSMQHINSIESADAMFKFNISNDISVTLEDSKHVKISNAGDLDILLKFTGSAQTMFGQYNSANNAVVVSAHSHITGSAYNSLRIKYIKLVSSQISGAMVCLNGSETQYQSGVILIIDPKVVLSYTENNTAFNFNIQSKNKIIIQMLDQDDAPIHITRAYMQVQLWDSNFTSESGSLNKGSRFIIEEHNKQVLYVFYNKLNPTVVLDKQYELFAVDNISISYTLGQVDGKIYDPNKEGIDQAFVETYIKEYPFQIATSHCINTSNDTANKKQFLWRRLQRNKITPYFTQIVYRRNSVTTTTSIDVMNVQDENDKETDKFPDILLRFFVK